ncbi:GNAT family N-acetyltransferase [Streptomyces sp. NPDC094143]|uniref:GNAT family N-acetyltransferase n=1 Tax=Streptomyces sp. NPDC094143 TaxID=3155310 RepID=UPI0033327779
MCPLPLSQESVRILVTGELARVRLAGPNDLELVNAMHARCSVESTVSRYRTPRSGIRPAEWKRLTAPATGSSWVAELSGEPGRVIAVAQLAHTEREGVRELGLLVQDDWQRRGLGTVLAEHVACHGRRTGCHTLVIETAARNSAMRAIAHRLGAPAPTRTLAELAFTVPLTGNGERHCPELAVPVP